MKIGSKGRIRLSQFPRLRKSRLETGATGQIVPPSDGQIDDMTHIRHVCMYIHLGPGKLYYAVDFPGIGAANNKQEPLFYLDILPNFPPLTTHTLATLSLFRLNDDVNIPSWMHPQAVAQLLLLLLLCGILINSPSHGEEAHQVFTKVLENQVIRTK